jgi:hypothetical protein
MKDLTEGQWLEGDQDAERFVSTDLAHARIFQDGEIDHIAAAFDTEQVIRAEDYLLTPNQISEMIKVPAKTVMKMLSRGEIPNGFKVNGFWRLKLDDYRRWLDAR